MTRVLAFLMIVPLAGCGGGFGGGGGLFDRGFGRSNAPDVETVLQTSDVVEANSAAAEGLTAEQRFLGFTVASLGDASVPGFWLETPLVTEETPGNVVSENGMVLPLILRPSGGERGSGSRLSLAAFQELGIDLTSLPTLTVRTNG